MKKQDLFFECVFLLFVALFLPLKLTSSPAYPGLINFTQPDGAILQIHLYGDEKMNRAETVDGYTIMYNSKGFYEYAVKQNNGDLTTSGTIAQNAKQRVPQIESMLTSIPKHIKYSDSQVSIMKQIRRMAKSQQSKVARSFPSLGQRNLVCLLIGFKDKPFIKSQAEFNNLFNQVGYSENYATGSVHDFFAEASYNKLNLNTTVAGPFVAANNMAYYGANDKDAIDLKDLKAYELITEAVNLADPTVNFANFDNDNDGYVDGIYVIYAGYGEESGGSSDYIWAHASSIEPVIKDGKTISNYACSCELSGVPADGTWTTSIGVICHEFGHTLGAPDYYDTNYDSDGQFEGTGGWDLQSGGNWNNYGHTPAQPNPFTKCYIYNWSKTTLITTTQDITMKNSNQNSNSYYRYNTNSPNEYFLLENKQNLGFDTYVPGHGLLIYHVDGNFIDEHYFSNDINNGSHQALYIIPASSTVANGIESPSTSLNTDGCPYPGKLNKTSFTDFTTPNSKSWNGTETSKTITNIAENTTDKTISFNFNGGYICTTPSMQATNLDVSEITNNTMKLSWSRGNGNAVIVVARANNAVNSNPIDGKSYVANAAFGSGNEITTGNYVIYNGTGTSVNLTTLTTGTIYHFAIYEINSATNCYLTPSLTGNASTLFNYNVKVPIGTKTCYIAGEMNGWVQQQMTKIDDTHYNIVIPNATTADQYKYCSGPNWNFCEVNADGSETQNRTYTVSDEVAKWSAVYDPTSIGSLTYSVTVPIGTKACYLAGDMNNWKQQAMTKVSETLYKITIPSLSTYKYKYCSGPSWDYEEFDANSNPISNRLYAENDIVVRWKAIYEPPIASLTYNVTVPIGTKACYIAGEMNGWNQQAMTKTDSTHYTLSIIGATNTQKYKYCAGPNWAFEELNADNTKITDRNYSSNDIVIKWTAIWDPNSPVILLNNQPIVSAGNLVRYSFTSQYVDSRLVDIWLPQGYSATKKYAVLYMQDGQNLFDGPTNSFNGQEWKVDETITQLIEQKKIRDVIVVGIWNSSKRYPEYFPEKAISYMPEPVKSNKINSMSGDPEGDDYLKFLVTELKPFIDKTFSTLTDANNTFIAGSSMGGLISWYAVCEYPLTFSAAACISTHWANNSIDSPLEPEAMRNYMIEHLPSPTNHSFYFDHGTVGLDANYAQHQDLVDVIMQNKGYNSKNWTSKVFNGADHSETWWAARLATPLEFILKPSIINSNIDMSSEINVRLFPNPTNKVLFIEGICNSNKLDIINLSGIKQQVIINKIDNTIDISNLPKGIYFIEINGRNHKIIKQ